MISLNDYLYSGDTVLKILKKYSRDLKISAVRDNNEVDRIHCEFLNRTSDLLEHNDFLTAQSQKIREFYKYMAKEYPYLSFTFILWSISTITIQRMVPVRLWKN